ncbi:MAG: HAD-IIIA family hydrolase [Nanoarchaeota archaeon]|nr:HAD-IIIA family hydrolase [Nanoarchaeota archaeon]
MNERAKIVFFDGTSGTGKDEQLPTAKLFFQERGYHVHVFTEPTPEGYGLITAYRRLPRHEFSGLANLHFFTGNRADHFGRNVQPLLNDPKNIILTGRSKFSTEVYQTLEGVSRDEVVRANAFYPNPDLACIFECEPTTAFERIQKRAEEKGTPISPDENPGRITKLRQGYLELATRYPQAVLINADGSLSAVETQVRSHLRRLLGKQQQKAIFLDKDGVLVNNSMYHTDGKPPTDKIYLGKTIEGLRKLQEANYLLFIISNQPWLVRGLMTLTEIEQTFQSVLDQYKYHGIQFTGYDYCPHDKVQGEITCTCHKPKTSLLEKFIEKHDIDISQSYFVGDRKPDIKVGRNMGLKTCLVMTGDGPRYDFSLIPTMIAPDVNNFAKRILA